MRPTFFWVEPSTRDFFGGFTGCFVLPVVDFFNFRETIGERNDCDLHQVAPYKKATRPASRSRLLIRCFSVVCEVPRFPCGVRCILPCSPPTSYQQQSGQSRWSYPAIRQGSRGGTCGTRRPRADLRPGRRRRGRCRSGFRLSPSAVLPHRSIHPRTGFLHRISLD